MAEEVRKRMKELEDEFTNLYKSICDEMKRAEDALGKEGGVTLEALRSLRSRLVDFRTRLIGAKSELRALLREARLKVEPEEVDELEEEVEAFFDKWDDMIEALLDDVRDLTRSAERLRERILVIPDVGKIVERGLEQTARGLEAALSKLKEALERGIEGPSYAVSVRLPQRDLEVIDALVEAGVFKSRSEAIAFFAHKGIETAKPLFQEALAKLEELRALREKLRGELRRAFEEGAPAG
ncbi:MAG: hypothetical protein ABWK01_02315 [Infirmifilum sp.]